VSGALPTRGSAAPTPCGIGDESEDLAYPFQNSVLHNFSFYYFDWCLYLCFGTIYFSYFHCRK